MNVGAVICDIYGTLLEVGPAPADADKRWARLWRQWLDAPPRVALKDFDAQCDHVIAREHAAARAAGVTQPEVFWPDVVGEVVPELSRLSAGARDDFLFQQARLWHTVRLMPGAADVLRELHHRGVLVGLASNCQPYTLRELDTELRESSLSRALFCPELCFFSFEHGFSKPDPHVFRWLAARLRGMGVTTAEALTLGDRIDNDIEPARAQGFQTWQLTSSAADGMGAGTWEQFQRKLTTD